MTSGAKNFTTGQANHSVQGRAQDNGTGAGGWSITSLGGFDPTNSFDLPPWGTPERDYFLRQALRSSTLFSAVVFGESSRVKNANFNLVDADDNQKRLSDYQTMLMRCDFGNGLPVLLSKVATDLLTQDNGAFIELLSNQDDPSDPRYTEAPLPTDHPDSFAHLDAGQCWRTFDPEYPVVYYNPLHGGQYLLHHSRVVMMSQFPQPIEVGRGMGLCALSRAYQHGRLVVAVNEYMFEKVTGSAPDLHITNIPFNQLQSSLLSSKLGQQAKGFNVWRDPHVISPLAGGVGAQQLAVTKISLKDMPDGFNRSDEMTLGAYMVAAAFGVDAREYYPTTASGATKADAQIQDAKSQSKGIKDVMLTIERALNWRILPPEITFEFKSQNPVNERYEAETQNIRAATRSQQILSGEITTEQARQLAVQAGDLPPEYLQTINTADQSIDTSAVIAEGNKPAQFDDNTLTAEEDKALGQAMSGLFLGQFESVVELGAQGLLSRPQFVGRARSFIQEAVNRAYLQGLKDGGYKMQDGLTPEMKSAVGDLARTQQNFARDLYGFVKDTPTPDVISQRMQLWYSKAVNQAYALGVIQSKSEQLLTWHLGATELHCGTCYTANGKTYTAAEWEKAGIVPQGDELECGGFRCQCGLTPAQKGVKRSKSPISAIPKGHKHLHENEQAKEPQQ